VESLEVSRSAAAVDPGCWDGKRVFVTGLTGFKGSWLATWLTGMGARVKGYSLAPATEPSLFEVLQLGAAVEHVVADVRDQARLGRELQTFRPDVVFHLAAQPLVRDSYALPVETYSTNVLGTVHLLDAVRNCDSVRAVVNVTTDKCYENREWVWGYRETDPLGGHDPYSSSKAASELVTASWRSSFFHPDRYRDHGVGIATARAGNVLGGGDWSRDRVIPDAVRAFAAGRPVQIRNARATRPWQHVLEPLSGYLLLGQALQTGPDAAEAWNFGPAPEDMVPVGELIDRFVTAWGGDAAWHDESESHGPHEAGFLMLDCSKARRRLGWTPRMALDECLQATAEWYAAHVGGATGPELLALTRQQIDRFSGF
jgi:CDP-glucose 4,6-dehydratase